MQDREYKLKTQFCFTLILMLFGIACLIASVCIELLKLRDEMEKYFLTGVAMQNCQSLEYVECHVELDDDGSYNVYWKDTE